MQNSGIVTFCTSLFTCFEKSESRGHLETTMQILAAERIRSAGMCGSNKLWNGHTHWKSNILSQYVTKTSSVCELNRWPQSECLHNLQVWFSWQATACRDLSASVVLSCRVFLHIQTCVYSSTTMYGLILFSHTPSKLNALEWEPTDKDIFRHLRLCRTYGFIHLHVVKVNPTYYSKTEVSQCLLWITDSVQSLQ